MAWRPVLTVRARRTLWRAVAALSVAALLGVGWRGTALGDKGGEPDSQARSFTPEEQARLAAGKLVVRRQTLSRGDAHYIGGMSWQVIDASAEDVWRTASDVSAYPRFLPAVTEARRVAKVSGGDRVFIRHAYAVVDASYCVVLKVDPARRNLRFKLDHSQPSTIDDAFGELTVSSIAPKRSVVTFSILVNVGSGIIARLLRAQVHEWTLRVPGQLKKHIVKLAKAKADAKADGTASK